MTFKWTFPNSYPFLKGIFVLPYTPMQWSIIQQYSVLKYWRMLQYGWGFNNYAKWKKTATKEHMLPNSIYMKCPKQANL